MHVSKIALSIGFVSSLVSAAPVTQEKRESISFDPLKLQSETFGGFKGGDINLEDNVSRGSRSTWKDVVTAYKDLFGDRVSNTKEAVSARDLSELSESLEKRLTWGKAGAGLAAGVLGWLTTKEGQDFINTDEGLEFVSKLAIVDDESLSKREPLASGLSRTAKAGLFTLLGMGAFGSGFATTKILARDVSGLNEKRLNGEIYGRIGGTLAASLLAGVAGWKLTKEGQDSLAEALSSRQLHERSSDLLSDVDFEARGKADYGSLISAIINGFNAIRSRDLSENDSTSARDLEVRAGLSRGAQLAAAALLGVSSFGVGFLTKKVFGRDVDNVLDDSEISALLQEWSKQAEVDARSVDDFDLLG